MRQRIFLLAAAGLVAVGLTAAPAHATAPIFTLTGPEEAVLRPHPGNGEAHRTSVAFRARELPPGGFGRTSTFSIGLTGLKGIADVVLPADQAGACTITAAAVTCTKDRLPATGEVVRLELSAAPGSRRGASAALTMTGTAQGATFRPATTRLKVGGVGLVMEDAGLKTEMTPGGTQKLPLAFSHEGAAPVPAVSLRLYASRGLALVERYDNCALTGHVTVTCAIEGEIKPGAVYETVEPITVKAGSNALFEEVQYAVEPRDPKAQAGKQPAGSATGRKLTVRERPGQSTARGEGSARQVDIRVRNSADLSAAPISLKGEAGDKVVMDVKVRNEGPAGVALGRPEEEVAVDLLVPPGAKVTRVPMECNAAEEDGNYRQELVGAPRYYCLLGGLDENGKASFSFDVQIERVVPDATGWVGYGIRGVKGVTAPEWDPKKDNNMVPLVINAKDGGTAPTTGPTAKPTGTPTAGPSTSASPAPSGSASPSASASTSPAPAGGSRPNGGLASTGTTAGPLLVGGAALLAAGGVLFLVFRRRAGRRA